MSSSSAYEHCVVDHHKLVNKDNLFPDVFFQVDDKVTLSAHYYILKMRLPQLLEEGPGANSKKAKKGKNNAKDRKVVIKLNKSEMITPNALEKVLIWAYSGVIDETDFTPFKAIEVMRACSVYNITRLMQMNEKFLQDNLTMKNIFSLLKFADSLNVQEAKDICIEFALLNGDFFTSTNAENLGFKLYQEVTSLLLKFHQNPEKQQQTIITVTEPDTIVADFSNLFESASTTGDISFLIQQEEVKAHKPLLSILSRKLAALVGNEELTGPIKLDTKYQRVSPAAFKSLLKFEYYGEDNIDMLHACELMSFVKDYKLTSLYKVLENVVGGQEVSAETVLSVLDVAYHPLMDENPTLQNSLKEEGLNFTTSHVDKINFDPLMTMPPVIGTHILQALQQRIGKNWNLIADSSSDKSVQLDSLNNGRAAKAKAAASASSPVASEVSASASKSDLKTKESKTNVTAPAPASKGTPAKTKDTARGKDSKSDAKSPRAMNRTKSHKHGGKGDKKEVKKKK
eukprot:TRINITY_DN880_c3_g1_i1.p1 TRINITY_DN880_c3_g1~~TRINITY_DN880_c3_g1_i1.p1  ORF type:complete len:529 (-),score=196.62 TRINITY_DN880_c3_g1_i1:166-1704(-)